MPRSKGTPNVNLTRLKADPIYFARQICHMEPTPQQAEMLMAIVPPGAKVSVRSGHGPGKTTGLSILILWFVSMYTHCRVPCTAPSGHQLFDNLWPEIHKWRDRMHLLWKRDLVVTADKVFVKEAEKTQFAVARTARKETPDALQGFHADHLMFVVDESSGVDDKIFEVAEGSLSTAGARVVMTGNPTRTDGFFYRSHHQDRKNWTTLHFSCLDSPNPPVDPNYAVTMREKYGEDSNIYRVRVLGEFPKSSDDVLIPLDWVEMAMNREYEAGATEKIAGLDVARFGDDSTALVVRGGSNILFMDKWRGRDLMESVGRVADYYHHKIFTRVVVDSIGMGSGVVDRLKELGVPVVGVNVGEIPAYKQKFNRLRDQLWWQQREFFESKDVAVSTDIDKELREDFMGQITSVRYGFTSSGKIKIEDKSEMKKRGLASPDLGDAVCLTLAEGVGEGRRRNYTVVNTVERASSAWGARI